MGCAARSFILRYKNSFSRQNGLDLLRQYPQKCKWHLLTRLARLFLLFRFSWLVVFSSTIATAVVFGTSFTFGSIIKRLLDKFQADRSSAAAVQGILVGVTFNAGIFSGILINRLGLWRTTLIGASLCSCGFGLAFFAPSIIHLCILIGFLTGIGCSIIFICCSTAIGLVFTGSDRVLGLAIQSVGLSVAGITLPYFFNILCDLYGLNGAFLIIGGVYLNCAPLAAILWVAEKISQNQMRTKNGGGSVSDSSNGDTDWSPFIANENDLELKYLNEDDADCLTAATKTQIEGSERDGAKLIYTERDMTNSSTYSSVVFTNEDDDNLRKYQNEPPATFEIEASNMIHKEPQDGRYRKCFNTILDDLSSIKHSLRDVISISIIILSLGSGLVLGSVIAFMSLVTDILSGKGFTDSQGLLIFPVAHTSGLLARFFITVINKCETRKLLMIPTFYGLCGCCGIVMIYLSLDIPVILIGGGLIGISQSCASVVIIAAAEMAGEGKMSVGIGLVQTSIGIFAATLGPVFGSIKDFIDSYSVVLVLTAVMQFIGACLFLTTNRIWKRFRESGNAEINIEQSVAMALMEDKDM